MRANIVVKVNIQRVWEGHDNNSNNNNNNNVFILQR